MIDTPETGHCTLLHMTLKQSSVIEAVLKNVGLGIIVIDKSGSVIFSNVAAEKIIGDFAETPIETWPECFGIYLTDEATICPAQENPFMKAAAGEVADNIEVLVKNPSSSAHCWCAINIRALRDDAGEVAGGILLLENISERKRLFDEVARSNSALQQFATVAAHDLQEPLRSIAGFADMLGQYQSEQMDDKSRRCLSKIKDGILRMQTLINDLLNFSRIQTKPQILRQTDCNEIVSRCIKSLDASIVESHATVNVESLPSLVVDPLQLTQLFQNLIGNAIKFFAADRLPVVRISAKKQELFWLFSVEDNGIGIAREFTERIFGVFQRLHNSTAYSGTGIGLAICQKIVERHGGRLWVESVPDAGSTFYFTLPLTLESRKT